MRTNTRGSVIVAMLALSILIGCGRDPSGLSRRQTGLFPLIAGVEWSYETVDSVEVGEPGSPPFDPWTYAVRVVGDTAIGGERWAMLDGAGSLLSHGGEGRYYLTNRGDGTYLATPPGDLPFPLPPGVNPGVLLFRYPARVGDKGPFWSPWKVTAVDTLISVPAGRFSTIRYDVEAYTTYFIAPGLGVVKKVSGPMELRDANGVLLRRSRLVHQLMGFVVPLPD